MPTSNPFAKSKLSQRLCAWLLVALAGCTALKPEENLMVHEPAFALEDLSFEERRLGRLLWKGQGKFAEGDFSECDVWNLQLQRIAQNESELPFTFSAPRAHLAFDEGKATFENIYIHDTEGREIWSDWTFYDEKQGVLLSDGPLHFATPALTAYASAAVVWLHEATIEIRGPVLGQLQTEKIFAAQSQSAKR